MLAPRVWSSERRHFREAADSGTCVLRPAEGCKGNMCSLSPFDSCHPSSDLVASRQTTRARWRRLHTGDSILVSCAETTPPNKQARPLGHRAKAGVVSVDSC